MNTVTNMAINGVKAQVTDQEWEQRVNLAACYRLVAYHGWDDLVFTHISARVPGPEHHFLINPYGLLFEEITASSLVKVDLTGQVMMDTPYQINPAGYTIHSAIHEVRDDAECVLHLHTVAGVAVACQKQGLLPLSQNSLFPLTSLAYHDYEGIALNPDEKIRLQADLGDAHSLILRNHGLLTVGKTVADAFLAMFVLQRSCEVQVLAQAGGNQLIPMAPAILADSKTQIGAVTHNQGGALAWPALLRKMDRLDPSFRE